MRLPMASLVYTPSVFLVAWLSLTTGPAVGAAGSSGGDPAWVYGMPLFTSSAYDPEVPVPSEFLGFEVGGRPVHHDELWRYLDAIDRASERVTIEEDGSTYEGRRLAHLVVSSPENHARMDAIRSDLRLLADPRRVKEGDLAGIVDRTPAICWLGYSIHGDELSGVDAALALAYELSASRDSLTERLLHELVVLIDPMENPDGRERFLTQTTQWKGAVQNPDHQGIHHTGSWPWGRGNHYLFDLNRDWFSLVHPETRGRVATMVTWNPHLVVDAHEMSGLSTFLFSPPREPFNPNLTAFHQRWWDLFAHDHAAAFDEHGWSYYTGEWNEEWYPGYGSSRARFTGAVGILYEEAGVEGSVVKQADGTLLTYQETVHRQLVSSKANLRTAADHRRELITECFREREGAIRAGREGRVRAFYFTPGAAPDRARRLARLLHDQGIEVEVLRRAATVTGLHEIWGMKPVTRTLPEGTFVVPLAQPLGVLARTILEFDPRMDQAFLESERRELEAHSDSRLYEVTGWSIPMAYGVEAYWADGEPRFETAPFTVSTEPAGVVENPEARYGYLIDPTSDAAVRALSTLLQENVQVRVGRKPFRVEGHDYPRGTYLLRRRGNAAEIDRIVARVVGATGITARGVNTAKSEERPDLGGGEFPLLETPRIAFLAGPPLDFTSFGALWWLLDSELALRASPIDVNGLADVDLSKYNVLVLPSSWGGADAYRRVLGDRGAAKIKTWVEAGGTLIALGSATAFVADSTSGLSGVRERGQVLALLESYRRALDREIAAREPKVDSVAVWEGTPISSPEAETATVPAEERKPGGSADMKVLEEEDRRGRLFRAHGAILRADLDSEHWLTAGVADRLPVLVNSVNAYLSKPPVETVARLGPAPALRLSGLLWPEARDRWAETAYLTRESRGKGQIILFAGEPHFRGQFRGSMRLLENALLLGPGLGARNPPPW